MAADYIHATTIHDGMPLPYSINAGALEIPALSDTFPLLRHHCSLCTEDVHNPTWTEPASRTASAAGLKITDSISPLPGTRAPPLPRSLLPRLQN
jgi:hypothetical protein